MSDRMNPDSFDGDDDAYDNAYDSAYDNDELAAELLELRAIGRRVGVDPVVWEAPPSDLWDRIAAETQTPAETHAPAETTGPTDASVTALRPRRQAPWFLAAAAAVMVIAGIVAVNNWSGDQASEILVASSQLDPLDLAPEGAAGQAELVEVDGRMALRVDVGGLADDDEGFHEVWIIDTEVSQLISLGPIRSDGTYELPSGIDPQAFPIVDISIEPLDGDPTHSGQSLLRGQLAF